MTPIYAKRKISDEENKLVLLYTLQLLGAIKQEELWPFLDSHVLMSYLDMCSLLSELQNDGALRVGADAGVSENALFITRKGEELLNQFKYKLPHSICTTIEKDIPLYNVSLRERQQVRLIHELAPENLRKLAIIVKEIDIPIIECHIITKEQSAANYFFEYAKTNISKLLMLYYQCTSTEVTSPSSLIWVSTMQEAWQKVENEKIVLCELSKHEINVVFSLGDETTVVNTSLLFAKNEQATAFANFINENSESILVKVRKLLWQKT